MLRRILVAAVVAVALPIPQAAAEPAAPQPGSPCDAAVLGALTPTDGGALECGSQGWQTVATPYPFSDRWVSLGPPVKLHGNGLRNAELSPGEWTGTPLEPDGRCTVRQVAVLRGVGAGPPEALEGQPGQPLSFTTPELLFSAEFSGPCLWQHR